MVNSGKGLGLRWRLSSSEEILGACFLHVGINFQKKVVLPWYVIPVVNSYELENFVWFTCRKLNSWEVQGGGYETSHVLKELTLPRNLNIHYFCQTNNLTFTYSVDRWIYTKRPLNYRREGLKHGHQNWYTHIRPKL